MLDLHSAIFHRIFAVARGVRVYSLFSWMLPAEVLAEAELGYERGSAGLWMGLNRKLSVVL